MNIDLAALVSTVSFPSEPFRWQVTIAGRAERRKKMRAAVVIPEIFGVTGTDSKSHCGAIVAPRIISIAEPCSQNSSGE